MIDRLSDDCTVHSDTTPNTSHARRFIVSPLNKSPVSPGFGPDRATASLASRCMCRNITELRGLEPPATREEVEAASLQFVRKVSGISKPNAAVQDLLQSAALEIAAITEQLLEELPARRQPPLTLPPLRRPEVRKRLGLSPFPS